MAHLAFTWELGAHTGYAALMAQIARLAIARGHRCSFIVRDLHAVAGLLTPELGPVLQAPLAGAGCAPPVRVQTSYASLLHHCGFGESRTLLMRLRAWRDLYAALGVDRVVARHSPTGIVAARSLGLPLLHYGTGFTVPPEVTPWPSFRPDLRLPAGVLEKNEARVLSTLNDALAALDVRPLSSLQQIYAGLPSAVLGYPELDHYGVGRDTIGMPDLSFGEAPQWPESAAGAARLFVSLAPDRHAGAWLDVLARLPAVALVRFPGGASISAPTAPNVHIVEGPVNFRQAVEACSGVLCYGSHNLIAEALLAGRPVAAIAHNPDHLMAGLRAQAIGAGIVLPEAPPDGVAEALARWLADPRLRQHAVAFRDRYARWPRDQVAATLLDRALAAQPLPLDR